MKKEKKAIYVVTLKIILEEVKIPSFKRLRDRIKKISQRKLIYTQGDNLDEIWELLKLAGKEWKYIELFNEQADFLRTFEPYSWYSTLTFALDVHPERADRCWYRWVNKLNEVVVGRRYREKHIPGISWVRVTERQKRDVLHFHGLLEHPRIDKVSYDYAYQLWRRTSYYAGKMNKIKRYNSKLGACGYLAKYIMKYGEIDFSEKITWARRVGESSTFQFEAN